MKTLFFLLVSVIAISLFACNKESRDIVFKGKYLANGCWPVIQILDPLDERFKEPEWQYLDSSYKYCTGTGLLADRYKNGQPFNFTIKSIREGGSIPVTTNCSYPKYIIDIEIISDTSSAN